MEDARLRRWQRISGLAIDGDELRELHAAVVSVCAAPQDPIARQHLQTLTNSRALHDQAVPFLSVEARAQDNRVVLAALREEARHLCEHVYRPAERLSVLEEIATREPDNASHLERLAWMYYLVGAWVQAGETLERLAPYVAADEALVFLRAAGRLYRNTRRNDRALVAYRAVALRKPSDVDALMALGELMVAPTIEPDRRFDPQQPPATTVQAPAQTSSASPPPDARSVRDEPASPVRSGAPTQSRVSPVTLTNRQAAVDAHDLFASLEDNEIEGSLAFAFGDDRDDPFRELPEPPPPPPKKSSRQTQERDDVLRPPAPPSHPTIAIPPAPVAIAPAPIGHTFIDLDEIVDAVNTGQHAVPDLAALGLAEPEEKIDVLEKLLATQRDRGAVRESAETCERLARLVTDDQRRRMLAEEAIAAYETIGDFERADALAIWVHRPVRRPHTR